MLALRLPPYVEKRLAALAKKTARTRSSHAHEAITLYLEDWEDYHLALARLCRGRRRVGLEELEAEFAAEKCQWPARPF